MQFESVIFQSLSSINHHSSHNNVGSDRVREGFELTSFGSWVGSFGRISFVRSTLHCTKAHTSVECSNEKCSSHEQKGFNANCNIHCTPTAWTVKSPFQ